MIKRASLNPVVAAALISAAAFIVQSSRILSVGGINPNLTLAVLAVFSVASADRQFLTAAAVFLGLAAVHAAFWFADFLILAALVFIAAFILRKFSPFPFVSNLILVVAVSTITFHFILDFAEFYLTSGELVYNLGVGFALSRFRNVFPFREL